jgi:hypothetical protein
MRRLCNQHKEAKPPPGKGYLCDASFEWTEVEGPVTTGIGNAKPDITESYRLRKYPQQAIDDLVARSLPPHVAHRGNARLRRRSQVHREKHNPCRATMRLRWCDHG